MAELKVQIGADTDGLKKALSDAEKALGQFGKEASDINNQLKKNAISTASLSKQTEDLNRDFKAGVISENAFGRGLLEVSKAEKKLAADSSLLSSRLLKVNKAASQLGSRGLKSVGKGAANAVPSMTSFSQVIQDAPFGIQGVANNITQLTMQFGNLSTKLGGTKSALKAMLSTLAGPAGILLAISVITSLMVHYNTSMSKARKKAIKLKKEQDKLSDALTDYVKALEAVQRANLKGEQSEQKNITRLRLLRQAAEDVSLSTTERRKAVQELQKLYPDYLGKLSKEKILNGDVSKTYESLTISILKRARATAAVNQIVKNSSKLIALESKASANLSNTATKLIELTKAKAAAEKTSGKERFRQVTQLNSLNILQKKYNALIKEGVKIEGEIQGVELENIDLEEAIGSGGIVATIKPDIKLDPKKLASSLDVAISNIKLKLAELSTAFSQPDTSFNDRLSNLMQQFTKENELINKEFEQRKKEAKKNANELKIIENEKQIAILNLKKKFNDLGLSLAKGNVKEELERIKTGSAKETKTRLDALLLQYQKFGDLTRNQEQNFRNEKEKIQTEGNNSYLNKQNEYLNTLLQNENLSGLLRVEIEKMIQSNLLAIKSDGIVKLQELAGQTRVLIGQEFADAASGIGDALGNALANGSNVIDALGGSLLASLGGVLVKLGKMAIATGIGLEAIKLALQNPFTGGIAAIGAGIALVALGAAFSAGSKSLTSSGSSSGSSTSGVSGGGTSSRGFSSGGGGSFSGNGGGTVVFEIAGDKLVGVLSRTLQRNKNLGGTLSITT